MSAADSPDEEEREYQRRRALKALRVYFAQRRFPRLMMSGILVLTGGAGFLASFGMLRAGLGQMWLRYPLALFAAWGVFLALVRIWVELERRYFTADEQVAELLNGQDPAEARQKLEDKDWSVLDCFDWVSFDAFDGDAEGCLAGVVLTVLFTVLLVAGWAVIGVLMAAPILLAEVFFDAVLVAVLYKRIRRVDQRWWLMGALRQTFVPVMATGVALVIAGLVLQGMAPGAKSVGSALKQWREGKPTEPALEQE